MSEIAVIEKEKTVLAASQNTDYKTVSIMETGRNVQVSLSELEKYFGKNRVLWWQLANRIFSLASDEKPEDFKSITHDSTSWRLVILLENNKQALPDPKEIVSYQIWTHVKKLVWVLNGLQHNVCSLSELLSGIAHRAPKLSSVNTHENLIKSGKVDFNVLKTSIHNRQMGVLCPNCGKDNERCAKYCNMCGYTLQPAVDASPASNEPEVIILEQIEFHRIAPGSFNMGNSLNGPIHKVIISKPFYLAIHPITQEQYKRVMGSNPSHFVGNDRPVDSVSWYDAQEFCQKLSLMTEHEVLLPTEAEWEYACRGGSETDYYWGDGFDPYYAWANKISNPRTNTVGRLKPNAWGLYDMSGNVWEWCQDWFYSYSFIEQTDPTGPEIGEYRVVRGGSCYNTSAHCTSASRICFNPHFKLNFTGFRPLVTRAKI